MKLKTREEFLKGLPRVLSEKEIERRYRQHVTTHQFHQKRQKSFGPGSVKKIVVVPKTPVHAGTAAAALAAFDLGVKKKQKQMKKQQKLQKKKNGVDGIPGAPRGVGQIVHAMFPRITWPKFESTSAGNFKMHPGRTLSGRQTQIIFMSWKLDRVATTSGSSSTAYYEIKPALFNGTAGGALNPVTVTKFTAFSAIWQQVRLLGLRFYFLGLQGKNCPGKIVTWLDYRVNSSSAPPLANLELKDTKTEILCDQRIAHVTWGREDLEDARFINASTANNWRPNDSSSTPNYDVLYLATDPSCPTSTALFDVYVHAFTEWTEVVV